LLEAEGIQIRLGAECIRLAHHAESVTANVHCSEGSPQITGSHVLIAVGRMPNTDDLSPLRPRFGGADGTQKDKPSASFRVALRTDRLGPPLPSAADWFRCE
jgi:hypothetical protein